MNRRAAIWLSILIGFFLAEAFPQTSRGQSTDDKLAITDSLSRTVSIPSKLERIISLQPELTRIIVSLGGGDKLVGLDAFLRRYDALFKMYYPKVSRLPLVSMTGADLNIEMVLELRPDVIFASPFEFHIPDSLQNKIRKPVVALASMGRFKSLIQEIELVGGLIGQRERASELIQYFKQKIEFVRNSVASIPQDERPKVYLSFWASLTKTPVFYEPVNAAGGVNIAEGLLPSFLGTTETVIHLEEIIQRNPDFILVQGNFLPEERMVTVEQVLQDARLGSVKAVKNRKVFYTFGFWSWWDPAEVLLETLYLASLLYPEKFGQINLEKEGNEIFKKFYGMENGFSLLSGILKCNEWNKN